MTEVFSPARRWPHGSAQRLSARLDRAALAGRLAALLRDHGAPIGYTLFGDDFLLCAPALPGVAGDPDIALVLGDADHGLFVVAQRERGALSFVSVHEAIHDAAADLLSRAAPGLANARGRLGPVIGACLG
ncbi:hypothetical protein [Roseomonas sp. CECT 9278]|uniref:hypothetical protein n=1 Tax=Roseomonas sp. CECT 9278 TaxID=2845823 RepID=UPI001E4D26B9|nr:hypothetical protein [Roseomonas sp. CECT 9278]CAH0287226.1 hypothetical protein ROS9278_04121 [Roseomonas sp. CECT 9278]